jgi:hypothetical protein
MKFKWCKLSITIEISWVYAWVHAMVYTRKVVRPGKRQFVSQEPRLFPLG